VAISGCRTRLTTSLPDFTAKTPLLSSSNPLADVFKLGWTSGAPAPAPVAPTKPKVGGLAKVFTPKKFDAKTVAKGYIPDGLSASQYAAVKTKEAKKRADKSNFWAKKRTMPVETLSEWFESVQDIKKTNVGGGHRFVKTKYDWSGGNN